MAAVCAPHGAFSYFCVWGWWRYWLGGGTAHLTRAWRACQLTRLRGAAPACPPAGTAGNAVRGG